MVHLSIMDTHDENILILLSCHQLKADGETVRKNSWEIITIILEREREREREREQDCVTPLARAKF